MPNYSDGHIVTAAEFNAMMPVGTCLPFAASVAPSGWLLCDGSAVSRSTYADLFSAIGTTWGAGDGTSTFNIPDLRGKIPVAQSTAGTLSTFAATGGEETHTLSTAELPIHSHANSATAGVQSVSHTHSLTGEFQEVTYTGGTSTVVPLIDTGGVSTGSQSASHSHSISMTNANAGSGTTHNNLQPYAVMLYIIRY